MARIAVTHTVANGPTGSAVRSATTNPTGDMVVDIDLTKFTTWSDVNASWLKIFQAFRCGSELKS